MARPRRSASTIKTQPASVFSFDETNAWVPPQFATEEEIYASSTRRGETKDSPLVTYPNLNNAQVPFKTSGNNIDTREAIRLCNQAYWAFPLLRNVVEVMAELANSKIYLKGGNKKTRDFIYAWFKRIQLWQLKEEFFREWFRSGNCLMYRQDAEFTPEDSRKMTQVFGSSFDSKIPVQYTILNPEMISAQGNIMFGKNQYYKVLSQYELQRIRNPITQADKDFAESLPAGTLKAIKQGGTANIPLDGENLSVLLYKAQTGYEPMAVPMAFGVLRDIEAKLELKRIDLSIARTTDRALLLISVGETATEHNKGVNINYNTIAALQRLFSNESVARTLVADYTVKAEWLIPEINNILGPEKYVQIDKDINVGLNAIIFDSDEKFANTSVKIQIFLERLREARNNFVEGFLQPEVIRVCKAIGAKNYPEIHFEDLSLKDEIQYLKFMLSMAQLGFLTPKELFEASESGKFPTNEESIESQKEFKMLREEGLYLPIVGGATQVQKEQLEIQQQQVDNQLELGKEANIVKKQQAKTKPVGTAGRPTGTKSPKAASTPKPMGAKASLGYSLSKFKEIVPIVSDVHTSIEKALKKKHGLRKLNETQAKVAAMMVESIISNEPQDKWRESVETYLDSPKEIAEATVREIEDLQIKHDLNSYDAAMLRLTLTEAPQENDEQEQD